MRLRGQDRGYAMAALLVAMSVTAILSTAAMGVWKQMSQREKEAELVFRGEQYARAIGLFQRKAGPGVNPQSLDVLVEQRFLRKKYMDPITGEDFVPISAATIAATAPGTLPGAGSTAGQGQTGSQPGAAGRGAAGAAAPGAPAQGGIIGVASKSKDKSIRIYNGRNYYNEWQFVYVPQTQAPGAGGAAGGRGQGGGPQGQQPPPGVGGVGGRGGRGSQPPGGPFSPGRGSPPSPPQRPPGN